MGMSTTPLVDKYRPQELDNVFGNKQVISVLKNILKKDDIPNLLFYGPPGTGKTTSIYCIIKATYTNYKQNVLELNASDERGISTIREKVKAFASTRSFSQKKKLIVLDECD